MTFKIRPIEWCISLALSTWLLVLFLFHTLDNHSMGRLRVLSLRTSAERLEGQTLSREQLDQAVSTLPVDLGSNLYRSDTTYLSATNWTVRMTPELKRAYRNNRSLAFRLVLLEFTKMDFPDIEFSCPRKAQPIAPANRSPATGSR